MRRPVSQLRRGWLYLRLIFISQLATEMRLKRQKLDDGLQNPQWDVVKTAFKVFKQRNKGAKV